MNYKMNMPKKMVKSIKTMNIFVTCDNLLNNTIFIFANIYKSKELHCEKRYRHAF